MDYILKMTQSERDSSCKVVTGESVTRQHRMVVCRIRTAGDKKKRAKVEQRIKLWKLRKEDCYEHFREQLRHISVSCEELPDD